MLSVQMDGLKWKYVSFLPLPSLPSLDHRHLLEGRNADMTMQMLHNVYNISSDTKIDLVRLVL